MASDIEDLKVLLSHQPNARYLCGHPSHPQCVEYATELNLIALSSPLCPRGEIRLLDEEQAVLAGLMRRFRHD